MAAMLDGRNNEKNWHENRFRFPEEIIVLFLPANMAAMQTLYWTISICYNDNDK